MSTRPGGIAPHVLHVLPDEGAIERIAAFGTALRHTLVTADGSMPAGLTKSAYLKPASAFPPLGGLPTPGRMQKLARAMTAFDLVLTYGPQALDVAMAHTLFRDAMELPALVHHESAPDTEHQFRQKWYRRLALGKSAGVVVPGEALEKAALVDWQQPLGRVKTISPGLDTKAFANRPKSDSFRLIKHANEKWVGAAPDMARSQEIIGLLRAFARISEPWQLVIVGERRDDPEVDKELDRLQFGDRVHFVGEVKDPARVMGLFDIYVVLADTDAFPLATAQAMAASVPVVAPMGSGSAQILAPEGATWLYDPATADMLGQHLAGLAHDKAERALVGEANRARAVREYDRDKVHATYRRLYASAMKQEF